MSESRMAARVMYCGHRGWFVADIYKIGNANLVRANGPVDPDTLVRGRDQDATHHMTDFPSAGYWNPNLGVFCVEAKQVKALQVSANPVKPKKK